MSGEHQTAAPSDDTARTSALAEVDQSDREKLLLAASDWLQLRLDGRTERNRDCGAGACDGRQSGGRRVGKHEAPETPEPAARCTSSSSTDFTMIRPMLMCFVLCVVYGSSKPTEKKSRVHHEEPLSNLEHDDDKNNDYDHEAFLGQDEARTFDNLPPEESKRRLGIIVDKIDGDQDGFVSEDELKVWIKSAQKKHIYDSVEHQWNDFDLNADGRISWEEYKNVTYGSYLDDPQADSEYNYMLMMARDERRFKVADRNGDLIADKQEFTAFLHPEDHEHMKDVVVQETIEDIDKNGDGFIDLKEYIGDMYTAEDGEEEEPDWVATERQQFAEFRDKNSDGKMDREETLDWILPADYDHAEAEAKHLLHESDANKDGKLSKKEIVDKYDVFVGSQVTDFGEALLRHDEF